MGVAVDNPSTNVVLAPEVSTVTAVAIGTPVARLPRELGSANEAWMPRLPSAFSSRMEVLGWSGHPDWRIIQRVEEEVRGTQISAEWLPRLVVLRRNRDGGVRRISRTRYHLSRREAVPLYFCRRGNFAGSTLGENERDLALWWMVGGAFTLQQRSV